MRVGLAGSRPAVSGVVRCCLLWRTRGTGSHPGIRSRDPGGLCGLAGSLTRDRAPPTRTLPDVGWSSPEAILRMVVFPHPEGPNRTTNSLTATARSVSATACTVPSSVWNIFSTLTNSISALCVVPAVPCPASRDSLFAAKVPSTILTWLSESASCLTCSRTCHDARCQVSASEASGEEVFRPPPIRAAAFHARDRRVRHQGCRTCTQILSRYSFV